MIRALVLIVALLVAPLAFAAPATFYVDTGGCNTGSTTQCSGTTDSATASASGAAATITCSATTGPAAAPGCSITGSAGQLGSIAVDGSQALFINCATNANNQKIFPVVSVDNGTGLVGTTGTPTGCTASSSDWGIGGRYIMPSGTTTPSYEAAMKAGDTVIVNNTPASRSTGPFFTARVAGDNTNGYVKFKGKAGVFPVLTLTGNTFALNLGNFTNVWIEGISVSASACTSSASGVIVGTNNSNQVITGNKITGSGGCNGIFDQGTGIRIINNEISGITGDGITGQASNAKTISGNYIHNNTGNGINFTTTTSAGNFIIGNVISNNTGRGIYLSAAISATAGHLALTQNVIYGNGNSGLEVTDVDYQSTITNNIFMNNGDAAGEYNAEWTVGSAEVTGIHNNNVFYHSNCQGSGTGGPACVSGLTPNATELTSDPLFANAGANDFSLLSTSPARAAGYPGNLTGLSTSTGFAAIGTFQPAATASGSRIFGSGL